MVDEHVQEGVQEATEQVHKLLLGSSVEDLRPTYQKDAVDDEFHMANGLALPKYHAGRPKSNLASSTGSLSDWGSVQLTSMQVTLFKFDSQVAAFPHANQGLRHDA